MARPGHWKGDEGGGVRREAKSGGSMQNREIGTRAFAGVGHGHADGSDLPLPGLAEEKRETGDGHQVATRLPNHRPGREKNLENLEAWRRQQTGSQLPSSPGRRHALSHAGREGGPLVAASARVQWKMENGKWKMENWGGGATHSNQELEIDVSGSCVTFQATQRASAPRPPPMTGPVCCVGHQRQERKNFRLGHDAFRPNHREQRGPAPFGFPAKSPCRATTCTARIWKGRRARKERWLDLMSRDEGELGSRLCATATRP